MFPLLIPMALGAAAGAMSSKKPLKGALLGAGLGAAGGYGAGLLGSAAPAAGAVELPAGSMLNGIALEGGMSGPACSAAVNGVGAMGGMSVAPGANVSTGLGALANGEAGKGLLASSLDYLKPAGQVAGAVSQARSLRPSDERPIQASPLMQTQPNNQLGQLVSGIEQNQQSRRQLEEQTRQARRQARGLL